MKKARGPGLTVLIRVFRGLEPRHRFGHGKVARLEKIIPQFAEATGEVERDDLIVRHRGELRVGLFSRCLQIFPRRGKRL